MSCVLSDKYFFLLKTNVTQGLCRWSLSITKQCPGWSHVCLLYKWLLLTVCPLDVHVDAHPHAPHHGLHVLAHGSGEGGVSVSVSPLSLHCSLVSIWLGSPVVTGFTTSPPPPPTLGSLEDTKKLTISGKTGRFSDISATSQPRLGSSLREPPDFFQTGWPSVVGLTDSDC